MSSLVLMAPVPIYVQVKVVGIDDKVEIGLDVCPACLDVVRIVLPGLYCLIEAVTQILFDCVSDELYHLGRILGLDRLFSLRDDRPFIQSGRFHAGIGCALSSPVEPDRGLKEPVIGQVLCVSTGVPDTVGPFKRGLQLLF